MSMSLRGSHGLSTAHCISGIKAGSCELAPAWPGRLRVAGQFPHWGRGMARVGPAVLALHAGRWCCSCRRPRPASGARTDRVTAAVMAEHGYALKTTALIRLGGMGVGRARCVVVAGVPWSIPSGMGPFHRGLDHLQQQLARARQVAVARLGGAWQAAGLSGRERSVSGRTGVWAPEVRHATEMPAIACRTMPSPRRADQARLSAAHSACPRGHPHVGLHGMGAGRIGRVTARWLCGRRVWQRCAPAV